MSQRRAHKIIEETERSWTVAIAVWTVIEVYRTVVVQMEIPSDETTYVSINNVKG